MSEVLTISEHPIKVYSHLILNQRDPSQTTVLRNAFVSQMNKRFRHLTGLITKAIVEEDVFGLRNPGSMRIVAMQTPGRRAFDFPRSADKVAAFMEWLQGQVDNGILQVTQFRQVGTAVESAWTNIYIQDSYRRGVIRARYELRKAGFEVPTLESTGGIAASMGLPFHIDRLGLLFTRTFNELKGITDSMSQLISRLLTQGIADGIGPSTLARMLNYSIIGTGSTLDLPISYINPKTGKLVQYVMPGIRRARILARTEIIRAHAEATLQEYKNWGVEGVNVKAEWITAGDNRVCNQCADLEGSVFTIEKAQGMLPLHPQCRCAWIPFKVTDGKLGGKEKWQGDEVAVLMKNPKHGKQYFDFKQDYARRWAIARKEGLSLSEFIQQDAALTKIKKTLTNWQKGAMGEDAMVYKFQTALMESGLSDTYLYGINATDDILLNFQRLAAAASEAEYLQIRAFFQMYLEQQRISSITLYRGVAGDLGDDILRVLSEQIRLKRTSFSYSEGSLVGYSSDAYSASRFGFNNEGFNLRRIVLRKDIHIPDLPSVTGRYLGEQEWIIRGVNKGTAYFVDFKFQIKIGDTWFTKEFGETMTEFLIKIKG